MIVSRQDFFKAQQRLKNIPFNQTEEWFEKCGFIEETCRFFIDDVSNPHIGCWGSVYKRKFIGEHLKIYGESYNDIITSHHLRDFYIKIISFNFDVIEIASFNFYNSKFEIGIRRAGFLRPMIADLSPLTLIINPLETRKTHKTWNKNLRLASDASLTFKVIERITINDTIIFCNLFEELKASKKLNYVLEPNSLLKLFDKNNFKLFFVYDKEEIPVAGRIVYFNDKVCYDVHAANSFESRNSGAAYFIIDRIINYMKAKDYTVFDYGMISPSNNEMDDIYRSKSYSGGMPTLYNGQWVYYKSKVLEYIMNGYYYFVSKVPRF
jgi:hypothetical protein